MDNKILSEAEWNRVFYASAPDVVQGLFYGVVMRDMIDYVKNAGIYLIEGIYKVIRSIIYEIRDDVLAVSERDPAAPPKWQILLTNQGVHAILIYRVAHMMQLNRLKFLARIVSQISRFFTGIEIHPSAIIGRKLLIDHGMGVVIGETAEIGDDCTLYQGVTLGGVGNARGKRHPTLRNGVFVGAGAKILGNIEIGNSAKIGANAVVLCDVPSGATAVGVPARVINK